ncbi:helix-turn-helix domain-containing protein [Dongia sp.]|uniref:helix-turn-helix domain-containing protein n=1 Tax=Dongia sp. TaxID=1977262 RepID=UPI0035AE53A9
MTPEQLKMARQEMGLTQQQMAFILKSDVSDVQGWESGACQVPGPVHVAIFLLEHCCDINPQADGSVSYSNRYLKIAERLGYKVPPGHDGPLPPQGAA